MWVKKDQNELTRTKKRRKPGLYLFSGLFLFLVVCSFLGQHYFGKGSGFNPYQSIHPLTWKESIDGLATDIISSFIFSLIAIAIGYYFQVKEDKRTFICESCNKFQVNYKNEICNFCGSKLVHIDQFKWVE